ncbi:MAG: tRNA uridine-5-carboxymethylaminomethyl(34) synthesis GTPase MnmE [Candidatus Saccharimonadia bacterium]
MNIDTIVALATPPGTGGVAVVRISGADAIAIGRRLHSAGAKAVRTPRSLVFGVVGDTSHTIDQGMMVVMPSPRSYTGEDVVELHLHGGAAIVSEVITRAIGLGARAAEPGEFTKRAYLNGKLDLIEAEAVGEAIAADTTAALRQAELKASGVVSGQIEQLRARLVAQIAKLSANLDFGEEDIADIDLTVLERELADIASQIQEWLAAADTAAIISDGLGVAIVGLPNAGKSSLLNVLVGFERAIVTTQPGTTRDTLSEEVSIRGVKVRFVDTAGLRAARDEVEKLGIGRSLVSSRQAQVVLVAASADQNMAKLRLEIGRLSLSDDAIVVGVQTKIDTFKSTITWPFGTQAVIRTSAITGEGLSNLRETIYRLGIGSIRLDAAVITSARQLATLRSGSELLSAAQAAISAGATTDVIAGELTVAAEQLGGLLGEAVSTEVIDAIFANFCIGK